MIEAMKQKLKDREAIDLAGMPREGRFYVLAQFVEEQDYCDSRTGAWMWSIGQRKSDGVILASDDGEFYQNPEYECLWLR